MDNLTLALKLMGKEKATEEKTESLNPSTASIVYMIAVTASSGGEVVLKDEIEETAEWEEGDFTEVDEDGDFEEYESEDDPLEDVDDTVVDMTDGDGVDIEETGGVAVAYTVAGYHEEAVAAYALGEGDVVEDDLPDENTTIDDVIDDGDAEDIPDVGELNEDDLPDENATINEVSDSEYTLTDANSDDLSDEIEGAEISDGYTVAECIGSVKEGDRVAVMVQNGRLTVIGVVGSGDEMEALREQAAEAADEASEAAADAQAKAEQAKEQATGAAQDATEAKQQADAANTAATNAQNAANTAATEAGEALQKANDAKSKADTVEENMTEVNAEVANVKENAVKLRADMESEIQTVKTTMSQNYATKDEVSASETTLRAEFTESVAGIQSTFAQDYAKKTELNDAIVTAKADLQSQITQNANSIALTVKSVEDIQVDITSQDGKIAAAQKAATDAQTVATQAKTDASEAQTAASNAQAQAQAANTAASQAQTEANEAKTKADAAQTLADSAKSDLAVAEAKLAEVESNVLASAEDIAQAQQAVAQAQAAVSTAQAAADKAKADAANAQTTADQAKTSASNANTAATNAQTKANEAKTAADNAQKSADEAKADLAALESRVVTAETKIEQNTEAIALRATKTEVTALAQRVSTAESKITADAIINTVSGTYVTKTDAGDTYATKTALSTLTQTVNGIEGRVQSAEGNISTLTQTASGLSVSLETVQSTANTAKSTADTAKTNAATAQSTADTAKTNAATAQSTANSASTAASNAQTTANTARTEAANAAKTATNFMSYDSTNGLLIGNKSSGSWSGSRAQILPSAFNILASNGTKLASYQANQIDLGMNSDATVINLCGGIGTIKSTAAGSGYQRMTIETGDSIDLETEGQIWMKTHWIPKVNTYSLNTISLLSQQPWESAGDVSDTRIRLESWYDAGDGAVYGTCLLGGGSLLIQVGDESVSTKEGSIRLEAGESGTNLAIGADSAWFSGDITAYGDVYLGTTNRSIYGVDTNGANRRLMNLNNNNNCVINYDSYVKANGDTNIYGNNITMFVKGNIYARETIIFNNGKGLRTYLSDGTTASPMIYTSTSNNLTIGNTTDFPNIYLHTANYSVRLSAPDSGVSAYAGYVHPSVDAKVTLGRTSHRWYRLYQSHESVSTSDERTKENIVPLGESPMATYSLRGNSSSVDVHSELFDRLTPVQYNFIEGDSRICYGLIAQQVVSAMEELGIDESELDLVHHDSWIDEETGEEKDSYGLAYSNLIALLIHEVQKLKQQIS